jgi:hypothetical protein
MFWHHVDRINKSKVTREDLYEQVWLEPMLRVAERHGVSSSIMASVAAS